MTAQYKLRKKMTIEALTEPGIYWADELPGALAIRVNPDGSRAWLCYYRNGAGVQRKKVLGRFPVMAPAVAFEAASKILLAVRSGQDPFAPKPPEERPLTVAEALKDFTADHVSQKKPNTRAQYEHVISAYIRPGIGARRVDEVAREDCARLIHRIGREKPFMANRVRAVLRKFFNDCERAGLRKQGTNPVALVERLTEHKRHRDLTEEQTRGLLAALSEQRQDRNRAAAVDVIMLLLFSGARVSEICGLQRSEVDLDRGMLRLPDSKTGEKTIYLNAPAAEILREQLKRVAGRWVFPSAHRENAPMSRDDLYDTWHAVRSAAGLIADDGEQSFRLHDLRHNFAATAAGAGFSLVQIGALLGHKHAATTGRYADLVNRPQRDAAEAIAALIQRAGATPKGVKE